MIGQTVSHYRIIERLGQGGMGVVYLAEDTVLGRRVAIKTLTDTTGPGNQHFRTRFLREARAVSSLSHPHIATIHDYGETEDGQPYIVMELVKGKMLSDLIEARTLNWPRAIQIVADVAEALQEAHSRGIIHRDIKPSNVAINERGEVKVLDFGLAKQINALADGAPEPQDLVNTQTRDGLIVGTLAYLSPEQALGVGVDARSDLFSLGLVLYECVTGEPAFSGASPMEICAKVLRDDPKPPSTIDSSVPLELDRITLKLLAKRPEDRYQSAAELITELRTAELGLTPATPKQWSTQLSQPAVSGLQPTPNRFGLSRNVVAPLIALLAAAGLGATAWLLLARRSNPRTFPQIAQTRLVISGNVKEATISPDGKYVASVIDEAGTQSVWLRQITTANELQVVSASADQYKGLSFSPNGDYIYYLKGDGDSATLHQVSVLGGASRKLASNVDTPVSFSPQGDRMTFVRSSKATLSTSLMIANSDGSNERVLATLKEPQIFSRGGFYSSGPAWSPDGSVIAVPAYSVTDNTHRDLVIVNVSDGSMKVINPKRWAVIEKVVWLADGKGFLINASDPQTPEFQIWLVTYPEGEARRITKDPNDYIGLSTTSDSSTVLTTRTDRVSSVWIRSEGTNPTLSQIPATRYLGDAGISWTTDGKFVFSSKTHGNYSIWTMDADGGNRRQLTFDDRMNIEPVVSPNGRFIVYASFEARHPHLWRIDADGGNPRQLTNGGDEDLPRFTPDGNWVVYHSINEDKYSIRKVPIDGGEPVILIEESSTQPDVSPDGKLIACFGKPKGSSSWKLLVVATDSGRRLSEFELPPGVEPEWPGVRWTPDGQSLTYVVTSQGVSNIWSQAVAGGRPKPLTDFNESQIFFFDWSLTNRKLALVRGNDTRDLVLVRDFL